MFVGIGGKVLAKVLFVHGLVFVDQRLWWLTVAAVAILLGLAMTELVRRRVDMGQNLPVARSLLLVAGLIVAALAGFGLTTSFWAALLLYWTIAALRSVGFPLLADTFLTCRWLEMVALSPTMFPSPKPLSAT